jgi:hypothetical protein
LENASNSAVLAPVITNSGMDHLLMFYGVAEECVKFMMSFQDRCSAPKISYRHIALEETMNDTAMD